MEREDALNVAHGTAVLTGYRQWVWRGESGNWWVSQLSTRLAAADEPCS